MDLVLTGQITIGWTLEKSIWCQIVTHTQCSTLIISADKLLNQLVYLPSSNTTIKKGVLADSLKSDIKRIKGGGGGRQPFPSLSLSYTKWLHLYTNQMEGCSTSSGKNAMLAQHLQCAATCLIDTHLYQGLAGAFMTFEGCSKIPDMGRDSRCGARCRLRPVAGEGMLESVCQEAEAWQEDRCLR